jgi:DNA ligase 1
MTRFDLRRRQLLAWLGGMPTFASARSGPGAPALLLAHDAPSDVDPTGFLVSEKLDGVRAYWDGRRLVFRSGLPIAAPAWFTERLPPVALDGELWLGRGRFESLSGIVRRASPRVADWQALRYMVFDLPGGAGPFSARAARLWQLTQERAWPQLAAVEQVAVASRADLQSRLDAVVRAGGEGLMLHRANAPYETGRSRALLKLKPLHDAEATVTGYIAGKGRHEGRLGALRVRTPEGIEFLIGTGFSDAQRDSPPAVGSVLTYTYRGRTEAGLPRFASFLRVRELP